jgi:hypothetical protein
VVEVSECEDDNRIAPGQAEHEVAHGGGFESAADKHVFLAADSVRNDTSARDRRPSDVKQSTAEVHSSSGTRLPRLVSTNSHTSDGTTSNNARIATTRRAVMVDSGAAASCRSRWVPRR